MIYGELVTQRVSRNKCQGPGLGFTVSAMPDTLQKFTLTTRLLQHCCTFKKDEFNSIQMIVQQIYIAVYAPVYCIPLALHARKIIVKKKRTRS